MSPDETDPADMPTLDLGAVREQLMNGAHGPGWSSARCQEVQDEYLRFLTLKRDFPADLVLPSEPIDLFWHCHILHTAQYARDCQQVFGSFLHHEPGSGITGADAEERRQRAWARTLELYLRRFQAPAPPTVWAKAVHCF